MGRYTAEYKENKLLKALDVCMEGILALGRPRRIGALELAKTSILPTALGVEKYDLSRTPYAEQILEDLNLSNRDWTTVVFCAVQRGGKSQLGEFLLSSGIYNNVDSLVMFGSQSLARDGSNQGFRRLIQNNPELKSKMLGGHGNSVFTQKSKAGSFITYLWPSETNIRQRTATITWANDSDMLGQLEGKGDMVGLLHARGQTKGSRQMHYVESAPYAALDIPPEECKPLESIYHTYPTQGVAGWWAKGTKFLWFWKCESCDERFHAGPENFHINLEIDPVDASESAFCACPHCGQTYKTQADKFRLNLSGSWIGPNGETPKDPLKNKVRSYRIYGPAAGFMPWKDLALDVASAHKAWQSTGDKSTLQRAMTSSMGQQWVDPDASTEDALKGIEDRAEEMEKKTVADGVHFLTTSIDQQKNRFVVQVHGWGPDAECWLVDRYNVSYSPNRVGTDGKSLTIAPGEYAEDFKALDKVITRQYKTQRGAEMSSQIVTLDTGGTDSATKNAYDYWKHWQKNTKDKSVFKLIKGRDTGERIAKSESVASNSGVVLWLLNVHRLKDEVMFALGREESGPRYVHLPNWLGDWFYDELRAEKKNDKGKYEKIKAKSNNEALDLLAYGFSSYTMAGGEKLDFKNPPPWAKRAGDRMEMAPATAQFNWASLGKTLNG
jgi:phage terminase large subunit GpA-like protein